MLIITQIITLIGVFTTYNYYSGLFMQTKLVHEEARTYRVYAPDTKDLTSKLEKLLSGKYDVQHTYTFTTSLYIRSYTAFIFSIGTANKLILFILALFKFSFVILEIWWSRESFSTTIAAFEYL